MIQAELRVCKTQQEDVPDGSVGVPERVEMVPTLGHGKDEGIGTALNNALNSGTAEIEVCSDAGHLPVHQ